LAATGGDQFVPLYYKAFDGQRDVSRQSLSMLMLDMPTFANLTLIYASISTES
jgi:hypothetical protein